jgi:hypothetical protein
MTLDEFIAELLANTGPWRLTEEGHIAGPRYGADEDDWYLLLTCADQELKRNIFNAADNRVGHDPAIRARLLKACGLAP